MILIGRHLSPFVRRCAVSLRLLDIAYEHHPLSTSTDAAEIRRITPLGRVPVLVLDVGEMLVDSAAILDYLDETVGPERALLPPRGSERRRALRLIAFATGAAEKAVGAYYEVSRRPPEKQWADWAEGLRQQVAGGLSQVEESAVEGGWLLGERLSQVDVSAVCAFDFVRTVVPEVVPPGRFPGLDALSVRANALAAFAETAP